MKLNLYTSKGNKKDSIKAPKFWDEKENLHLLAQAIRVYENKKHSGSSKTKNRGEVVASTRKIYRQKGTGLARHGALSAPIFVGGGKAHGPDGLSKKLGLPKKMKKKALNIALGHKAKSGGVFIVDGFSGLKKTKEAAKLVQKLIKSEKNMDEKSTLIVLLSKDNKSAERVFKNLEKVETMQFKDANAYKIFFADGVVIDKKALKNESSKK